MADLLETARLARSFTTLLTALEMAGLSETLKASGPFTLFAPTDDAFAALSVGILDALLQEPERLKDVLSYHIVSGMFTTADLLDRRFLKTLQGQRLTIEVSLTVVEIDQLGEPTVQDSELSVLTEEPYHSNNALPDDVLLVSEVIDESGNGIPDDVVLTEEAILTTVLLENVTVDGANILQSVSAENGILYALDAVLMPRVRPIHP